jgi:hypothetical protein
MSNIYQSPIHGKFSEIKGTLCGIIEGVYSCPEQDKGTMEQAELTKAKQEAVRTIADFCYAIEQKMELLNYKLQMIKTFDWEKEVNFEKYKSKSDDQSVEQILQDGKLKVRFFYKDTMLNFIYTEISTFFSTINSIIDNIAEILYYTFNLEFNHMRTIKNVATKLEDGNLKSFIQQRFCDDLGFCGMRDIRTVFEHKNHIDAVHIERITRSNLFGGNEKEVIIARVNTSLIKAGLSSELNTLPDGDKIDSYCDFLYKKITEALSEFIIEISKT